MLASSRRSLLPPIPPAVRFALLGAFVAGMAYVWLFWQPEAPPVDDHTVLEPTVVVPQLDPAVLALAKDEAREQRLMLEAEPLRHLLDKAIDVGPTVAFALGLPPQPVPLATLRADPDTWRGRWLSYEGTVETLGGPRDGHPVKGYSIYEAMVRLPDGEHVFATFSIPPPAEVQRGSWVRVDGFLMKLRDTTYPREVERAPLLVGREIQRDYEDWPAVTELDRGVLAKVEDESWYPGDKAWHTLDEDQTEPLWHLGAFVRDTAGQRTLAEWRKVGALNAAETLPRLTEGKVARGDPMRVLGILIRRKTIAAPTNPAGIRYWTELLVQVPDLAGHLVPVWIPQKVRELPSRASVEVLGHFYRWFVYEGGKGDRYRVPLVVAADVRLFQLDMGRTMREIGLVLGSVVMLMIVAFWWIQRRAAQQSLQHSKDMDARRRRLARALGGAAVPPGHGAGTAADGS